MEHTKNKRVAKKIAMDHLREDPDYYKDWERKEKILFMEKVPDAAFGSSGETVCTYSHPMLSLGLIPKKR